MKEPATVPHKAEKGSSATVALSMPYSDLEHHRRQQKGSTAAIKVGQQAPDEGTRDRTAQGRERQQRHRGLVDAIFRSRTSPTTTEGKHGGHKGRPTGPR